MTLTKPEVQKSWLQSDIDDLDDGNWTTIFNAKRDNNGKGVPIRKFIKALENTLK